MTIDQKICEIEIEEIRNIGEGDDVCLTFQKFKKGHCILAGIYSRALFLIPLAEKVNAGCVSTYVFCKDRKTKYLNELKSGDELLTMDSDGNESSSAVAESKIKRMPMTYIKGAYKIPGKDIFELLHMNGEDYFNAYRDIFPIKKRKTGNLINVLHVNKYKKKDICAYLDASSTFSDHEKNFVMYRDGTLKSLTQLKREDKILAYIQMPALSSRHFGMKYDGLCLER